MLIEREKKKREIKSEKSSSDFIMNRDEFLIFLMRKSDCFLRELNEIVNNESGCLFIFPFFFMANAD